MKVRIKDEAYFKELGCDIDSWPSEARQAIGQVFKGVTAPDSAGQIYINGAWWYQDEYDIIEETIPVGEYLINLTINPEEKTEYSDKHYNFSYQLSEKEIETGEIRLDPYKICKVWGLNEKDDTGGLFHLLKTISRYGDKNPKERELKAIKATAIRMEELLKENKC